MVGLDPHACRVSACACGSACWNRDTDGSAVLTVATFQVSARDVVLQPDCTVHMLKR